MSEINNNDDDDNSGDDDDCGRPPKHNRLMKEIAPYNVSANGAKNTTLFSIENVRVTFYFRVVLTFQISFSIRPYILKILIYYVIIP